MDSLEIQGKKYISSKRASELTGYAKDYIGQLARGGKLPGTRVGRAWYVDEAALVAFAGVVAPLEMPQEVHQHISPQETTIHSVKALSARRPQQAFSTWKSVTYHEDNLPVLPTLQVLPTNLPPPEKTSQSLVSSSPKHTVVLRSSNTFSAVLPSTDGMLIPRNEPGLLPHRASPSKETRGLPLLLPIGVVAAIALVFLGSGALQASEWSFSAHDTLATPLEGPVVETLTAYFLEIFNAGIDILKGFINILIGSFETFFSDGLDFIVELLHLG